MGKQRFRLNQPDKFRAIKHHMKEPDQIWRVGILAPEDQAPGLEPY